jgi:hypothetical protein
MAPNRLRGYLEGMESVAKLRAELEDAIAKVRRQIDVQRSVAAGLGGGLGGDAAAIRALQIELSELEDALANLEPDDPIG